MKSFFAFIFVVFFASITLAQDQTQQTLDTQGWIKQNSGTTHGLVGVSFNSSDTGWVAAANIVLRTTDAGLHWSQISVPGGGILSISSVDGKTAWGGSYNNDGKVYFTGDGGQTWIPQNTNSQPEGVTAISFPTRQNGFGVGHSFLIKTTNGGQEWTKYDIEGGDYHAVHFLDSQNGLIAGIGILLRVLLGGPARIPQKDPSFGTMTFYGCYLPTQTKEFAVGIEEPSPGVGLATIVRSINSGSTWDKATIPLQFKNEVFDAITFTDSLRGTVVGSGGAILNTSDGGDSWIIQASGVNTELLSVSFSDSLNGTIVGELGIILRTTNGGYSWVQANNQYDSLSVQVYPDPGNQFLNLSYVLPIAQSVSLSISDVAGNPIGQILNNSFQDTGINTVAINTSFYPSGSYYFQMRTSKYFANGQFTIVH